MKNTEPIRRAEKRLQEIEKKLKELIEDLKERQERLRRDSSWPRTLSLEPDPPRPRRHEAEQKLEKFTS